MQGWNESAPDCSIRLCEPIAAASDRAAISYLEPNSGLGYGSDGLEIHHLLSGRDQHLKLDQWHDWLLQQNGDRHQALQGLAISAIPESIRQESDPKKVFWWFWRCYLPALQRHPLQSDRPEPDSLSPSEDSLALLPSDPRFPDASCWSHSTMTSAIAGSLNGYPTANEGETNSEPANSSHPHVAIFSFSPIQELIKASRKMRDFWAGSWVLHYLSAKVCWAIAQKYGPDTLLYPCLYEQPLIDHWLRETYPEPAFTDYITEPTPRALLTAGFPNVLVMILPDNGKAKENPNKNLVQSALAYAEQTLRNEWQRLGDNVLGYLQKGEKQKWMKALNSHTWHDWLKNQWQFYSVALPIGDRTTDLSKALSDIDSWAAQQNRFSSPDAALFQGEKGQIELSFFQAIANAQQTNGEVNVGSWWPKIFEQTRAGLGAVKTARTWKVPTAYSVRSSISGIGPAVATRADDGTDWVPEGRVGDLWEKSMGMFDGTEMLNATEVLKRGLHKILGHDLFGVDPKNLPDRVPLFYPDLTAGAAGWLRRMEEEGNQDAINAYRGLCQEIKEYFPWITEGDESPGKLPWGIPWVTEHNKDWLNARLLNPGWAGADYNPDPPEADQPWTKGDRKQAKQETLRQLRAKVEEWFSPGNNPTDWYVLAAGDGDGMGKWLNGSKLDLYSKYVAKQLNADVSDPDVEETLNAFLTGVQKRMGPASHSALSRALLDFSNRLLPHLTEERYAGRLIYGGGDDVLAYTNLWEWDGWLWDIRQCFCGGNDDGGMFENHGDYWQWKHEVGTKPDSLPNRPLFTMGNQATVSFGMVIAHHSVPLAIALENLWDAESKAKKHHVYPPDPKPGESEHSNNGKKDAVQVRVIYGNGNVLKATSKFQVFQQWRSLLQPRSENGHIFNPEPSLFEQAAQILKQHPIPIREAIQYWVNAFCDRREQLSENQDRAAFQEVFQQFLETHWDWHRLVGDDAEITARTGDQEIQNWLKLAAFVLRNRDIKPRKTISEEVK